MNNIDFNTLSQTANAISENRDLAIKKWSAKISWMDGVQNQISIRDFSPFLTDEPIPLGGTDKAPNPVEYLIGAAGSCFAITFQVIASQNKIELNDVHVEIEADLNAAVFLGIEEGNGGILKPVIKLKATTSAEEALIRELADIALSKSPVLLSLNPEIELAIQ